MSMVIRQNLMAESALRNLTETYGDMSTSIERLSSGLRITGAEDDAAGLAVREGMRSEVRALGQGIRNSNDAISMLQTYDGAAQVIDDKLIRMKELAMQSATGTYDNSQREIMDDEFQAMADEIERIAQHTEFNQISGIDGGVDYVVEGIEDSEITASSDAVGNLYVVGSGGWDDAGISDDSFSEGDVVRVSEYISGSDIEGTDSSDLRFEQVGQVSEGTVIDENGTYREFVGSDAGTTDHWESLDASDVENITIHFGSTNDGTADYYKIDIQDMTRSGLGIDDLDIRTQGDAQEALEIIDSAIEDKVEGRAHFGAMQNRLSNTVSAISIQRENLMAAESQISDADVAQEMSDFTGTRVQAQAGVAMLAQANMVPEMALQLLG